MAITIPSLGRDVFVTQVRGTYSCHFAAEEGLIEYCGVNGSVGIDTGASGYDDSFLMSAGGDFSGWHQANAYVLSRGVELSGGGNVHALTHAYDTGAGVSGSGGLITYPSGTTIELTFAGSYVAITEDIDFGNLGVDPPGVGIRVVVDAEHAWVRVSFDVDDARIQELVNTFGLSGTQATNLYQGGVLGLIGELSQFGYSGNDVVNLALTMGLAHLEELLGKLSGGYVPGPIDKAASKYDIPWGLAKNLYSEFGETAFIEALGRSADYKTFMANLKGWDVSVFAGSLLSGTEVTSGEIIHAAFRLFHPVTGEQFYGPQLAPYANIAQVLPNGKINGLAGYFSYIEFSLDETTGTYRALINTAPDETNKLEPGEYCAYIVLRNPGNDMRAPIKVNFTVA